MNNPIPKYAPVIFDPWLHTYEYGGKPYDHLTGIMRKWGFGYQGPPVDTTRGNYLHGANELLADDDLDFDAVPEQYRGYVHALQRFYVDRGPKVLACELPLVDPLWGFATTPDLVAFLGSDRSLVELKTGDDSDVDVQLGAQFRAWTVNFEAAPIKRAFCLKIRADSTYRLCEHDIDSGMADFAAIMRLEHRKRKQST